MASDIGGLMICILRIFSLLVGPFASLRLDAIITGSLFHLSQRLDITNENMGLNKLPCGEITLDLPNLIDWDYLKYTCCFWRRKNDGFKQYKQIIHFG